MIIRKKQHKVYMLQIVNVPSDLVKTIKKQTLETSKVDFKHTRA
jgi:hypothetical protein